MSFDPQSHDHCSSTVEEISRAEASWPAAALFSSCPVTNECGVFNSALSSSSGGQSSSGDSLYCLGWSHMGHPDQQFQESYPVPDTEPLVWRPMASWKNIIPGVG